ncbi:MAG: LytR/AlgR family response regulator transcription factor [Flammeovirgaceae bacterium]
MVFSKQQLTLHLATHAHQWRLTLMTGFFLFIVLFFYKGYNIQQGLSFTGHSLFTRALLFGMCTSLSFGIHEFLFAPKLLLNTFRRRLWWSIWEVFIGAAITFVLFNYFWEWTEWDWAGYRLLLIEYTLVMMFPISISLLLMPKKGQAQQVAEPMLLFQSENKKQQLRLKPDSFLYIKSEDNYINIFYLSNGLVKSALMRQTMKKIETEFTQHENLMRCHRSYLVNPEKVNQVHRTTRHVQLDIGYDIRLPVSKKYQEQFMIA